ncbi:Uncharacterised protein [Mannheimia haemolytica]|uniref:Transferrin-binding protein B C-lobe/N-lobe beta barrel domain-containing protein n=1 Tax=Mannheimia haemolytica TaxID=75985 RepID=A0A3S5B5M6_MANHA|nr:hypothetical protein [Mannheimia haemolytica]VEI77359.1 Uncharacterised protein [Mannheimia haemolytica]
MRSTFKLTLAALAVSIVLSGCKSSQGPSIVADSPPPKEITATDGNDKEKTDNKEKKSAQPNKSDPQPDKPANAKDPVKPDTETNKPSKKDKEYTPPATEKIDNSSVQPDKMVPNPIENKENDSNKPNPKESDSDNNDKVTEGNKPNAPTETVNKDKEAEKSKKENKEDSSNNTPNINFDGAKPIDTDSKGSPYRVINLNPRKSVVNASAMQKVDFDSFTDESVENSPFVSSDTEKEYNNTLVFGLGAGDKDSYFKNLNQKGDKHLGIHRGTYEDEKIEGDSQAINYLYVNQPYSSYGALFTNENDSHLFSVHLAAGQKGENTRGDAYAEYGVFSNEDKWNENLVGNATYKGQTIARVVRTEEGKQVASLPQFDGDVTLNLDLAENWEDSKLSGQINSKTLGKISLNETQITPSSTVNSNLSFGEEATVEGNDSFEGEYHVEFTGPNLEDAVGGVELENEELKYNAVFGATKSAN